jgi:hypothetical protein
VRRAFVSGLLLALLVLPGCSREPQPADTGAGTGARAGKDIEDTERGFRFTLPPEWVYFGSEIRSRQGTIMSIEVHSLEGAQRDFVEGLPDALIPQLEAWARNYFEVVEAPERSHATIGGRPAMELSYRVQPRAIDNPSQLTYWTVRYDDRLLVLRAAYPARALSSDEGDLRTMLASWAFYERTGELTSPPT